MFASLTKSNLSRRTAIAGLGAGGIGLGLARSGHSVSAQDATPASMANHPLVGTWIILPRESDPGSTPSVSVFTPDGAFIDANGGLAGLWHPTGPNTADHTFVGIISAPDFNGYVVVRGQIEVDQSGEHWSQTYNAMTVSADGTVANVSPDSRAGANRLHIITADDPMGDSLSEVPTWTPVDATPTA